MPFINQSKYLSRLIDDIFASLLGDDYNYLGSDGTTTLVIQDGIQMAAGCVRLPTIILLYLDVLTQDIGAIQIIPHSHKYGNQYAESLHE